MEIPQRPFAFVDVETTGTRPGKHELLEVGVVITAAGAPASIVDSIELKIKPERLYDAQADALVINRYSEQEWANALPSDEAMKKLAEKIKGAAIYGWNVGFDRAFLESALNRAGIGIEDIGLDYTWYDVKMDFIRWAKLTKREEEFGPRYSLGKACRAFRVENEDAHRALSDALTTHRIYLRLEEEFAALGDLGRNQRLAL